MVSKKKFRKRPSEKFSTKKNFWSTKNIMSIFFVLIMATSIAGIVANYGGNHNTVKYKDYKFTLKNGEWLTKINGQKMAFLYSPSDVDNINDSGASALLSSLPMFTITYDPDSMFKEEAALLQFHYQDILSMRNVYVMPALTFNASTTLPVVTCANATPSVPVVYITSGNYSRIRVDGNCIIIEGVSADGIVREGERILYGILRVID